MHIYLHVCACIYMCMHTVHTQGIAHTHAYCTHMHTDICIKAKNKVILKIGFIFILPLPQFNKIQLKYSYCNFQKQQRMFNEEVQLVRTSSSCVVRLWFLEGCTGERSPGRPGSFWRSAQDLALQPQKGQLPAGILEAWHFLQWSAHQGWWLRLYCRVTALGTVGISSLHLPSLLYLFLHFPAWQALWNLPSVGISFVSVLSLLLTPIPVSSLGFLLSPFLLTGWSNLTVFHMTKISSLRLAHARGHSCDIVG